MEDREDVDLSETTSHVGSVSGGHEEAEDDDGRGRGTLFE